MLSRLIVCVLIPCACLTANVRADFFDGMNGTYVSASAELDLRGSKPERDPNAGCAIIPGGCFGDGGGEPPWNFDTLLNFRGEIAPDWYLAYPCWINTSNVNQAHFEIHRETTIKTEGTASLRIETIDEPDSLDSAAIEDIYIARRFPTVAGQEYAVTFDLRASDMRWPPADDTFPSWIMFSVLPSGSLTADDIVDIENHDGSTPCFLRPDTQHVPGANLDEQWHSYLHTFTAEGNEATFVMLIRNWWTPQGMVQPNYIDNLNVQTLPHFTTAALGPTGQTSGCVIDGTTFQGTRFHLDDPLEVEEIGGHLTSTGTIFGAIVALGGSAALPVGNPLDVGEVVSVVAFDAGTPSSDVRVPMHVVLPPGDYALVFGSGQYLATGSGFAPVNNADLPAASFIEWSGGTWSDSAATGKRFVIEGHSLQSVPALTTWGKVAAACVLLAAGVTVMRRRRRVSFR